MRNEWESILFIYGWIASKHAVIFRQTWRSTLEGASHTWSWRSVIDCWRSENFVEVWAKQRIGTCETICIRCHTFSTSKTVDSTKKIHGNFLLQCLTHSGCWNDNGAWLKRTSSCWHLTLGSSRSSGDSEGRCLANNLKV